MSNLFVKTGHAEYTILESGPYYVGDPCYCFSHDTKTWLEFCESMDNSCQGIFTNKNHSKSILALSTAYGDGLYNGFIDDGYHNFPVDAGILGLVKVSDIEQGCSYLRSNDLGCIITLNKGSVVTRSNDGTFKINDENNRTVVFIATGEEIEEDANHYDDYLEDDC